MILDRSEIATKEVFDWKGLHLLHFQSSTCSQKVRILLAEKRLPYTSHHVNLARHEHVTPWYLGINPRGVVPVLVHDGVVHVESNDILAYLDGLPSEAPSFFPQTELERAAVDTLLAHENDLHFALREITMGFIFPKRLAQKSEDVLAKYERDGVDNAERDKEIQWWQAYGKHGVTREQARAAVRAFHSIFSELDAHLKDREWLIGERISALEIAWFINMNRLSLAGYPLDLHPRLFALYQRLRARPAFTKETAQPAVLARVVLPAIRLGHFVSRSRMKDVAGDILV